MRVKLLTEQHLEFLHLKGACTGSSESTLVKMPHCWKSHVTAHLAIISGLFRRIATASMKITHQEALSCFHDIKEINENFLLLGMSRPTLTLQYCNVLILLNFNDQSFWSDIIGTPNRKIITSNRVDNAVEEPRETMTTRWHCCNLEILRRGGLILFCDYAVSLLFDRYYHSRAKHNSNKIIFP